MNKPLPATEPRDDEPGAIACDLCGQPECDADDFLPEAGQWICRACLETLLEQSV